MALLILASGTPVIPLCVGKMPGDGNNLDHQLWQQKAVTDVYFLLRLGYCKINYTFILHVLPWQQDLHARLLPLLCFHPRGLTEVSQVDLFVL